MLTAGPPVGNRRSAEEPREPSPSGRPPVGVDLTFLPFSCPHGGQAIITLVGATGFEPATFAPHVNGRTRRNAEIPANASVTALQQSQGSQERPPFQGVSATFLQAGRRDAPVREARVEVFPTPPSPTTTTLATHNLRPPFNRPRRCDNTAAVPCLTISREGEVSGLSSSASSLRFVSWPSFGGRLVSLFESYVEERQVDQL